MISGRVGLLDRNRHHLLRRRGRAKKAFGLVEIVRGFYIFRESSLNPSAKHVLSKATKRPVFGGFTAPQLGINIKNLVISPLLKLTAIAHGKRVAFTPIIAASTDAIGNTVIALSENLVNLATQALAQLAFTLSLHP